MENEDTKELLPINISLRQTPEGKFERYTEVVVLIKTVDASWNCQSTVLNFWTCNKESVQIYFPNLTKLITTRQLSL